jgi:hypothetical protein
MERKIHGFLTCDIYFEPQCYPIQPSIYIHIYTSVLQTLVIMVDALSLFLLNVLKGITFFYRFVLRISSKIAIGAMHNAIEQ